MTIRERRQDLEKKLYGDQGPFETFRKYSPVHHETAKRVVHLLNEQAHESEEPLSVLDIGAGDSLFTRMVVDQLRVSTPIEFTWLEPNEKYAKALEQYRTTDLPKPYTAWIINEYWETYGLDRQYDVILAIHLLYYLPPQERQNLIAKMIGALKTGGQLFMEVRTPDDDDDVFLRAFHKRATKRNPPNITIRNAIDALHRIKVDNFGHQLDFDWELTHHHGFMQYPDSSHPDFSDLIQFHLLHPFEKLVPPLTDERLQADILQFLEEREFRLYQREGDIYVRRH